MEAIIWTNGGHPQHLQMLHSPLTKGDKMAQWVEALTAKVEGLLKTPETHRVEGKKQLLPIVL